MSEPHSLLFRHLHFTPWRISLKYRNKPLATALAVNMHTETMLAANPNQVLDASWSKAGAKADYHSSAADSSFLAAESTRWKQRK